MKNLQLRHRDTIDFSKGNEGDLVYIGVYTEQACNLKCKYCFESAPLQPGERETTLDERRNTISQARDLGAEILLITGAGEPLVDKTTFPMIEHAYNLGMGTLLYTNGLEDKSVRRSRSISPENAKFLYEHDVTPIVKLESLNQEAHDYLTDVNGSHEKALEAIQTLREQGYNNVDNGVTRLGIAALYTTRNLEDLFELKEWCDSQSIKFLVDVIGVHGRAKQNTHIVPTMQEIINARQQMGRESGIDECGYCTFWKYGLIIDHAGEARHCTEISTRDIGNIRDFSVEELLKRKNEMYPSKKGEFTCPLKEGFYLK